MKNVIETLNTYYQSFINQKRDWGFFLGLADYIKYVVEAEEIDNILKPIVQAQNNDQKRLRKYEKEVIKETKEAKEKLAKIIKKHNILYESLIEEIKEYQAYEDGTIKSSQDEAGALSDALMNIIRNLLKNGHKKLVKDFAIEHKEIPDEIGKYTFSKTLDLYYKEKEIFNEKFKTELWASWNHLILAYLAVFKANEELEKLRKNEKDFFKAFNFTVLVGEMRKIRDDDVNKITGVASVFDFEPVNFKKENYIFHATRIHNYLIRELNKEEVKKLESKEKQIEGTNLYLYLNQNGELYREPKDKYYYPMDEKKDRYKIIRFLLKNGYKQTLEISGILNGKSIKSIQTEINKINNVAMNRLKIKDRLIKGKKGSGYRINPKYKIIAK
jgi:hypothetical protein